MFCQNCGQKIDEGVAFCPNCGANVMDDQNNNKQVTNENDIVSMKQNNNVQNTNLQSNPNNMQIEVNQSAGISPTIQNIKTKIKNLSKKQKGFIIGGVGIIVLLFVAYKILTVCFDPINDAEKFAKAFLEKDYEKVYSYLDIEESEFVNVDSFKVVFEKQTEDIDYDSSKDIDVDQSDDKDYYTVTYYDKGTEKEEEFSFKMKKNGKKKFLFFDSWSLNNEVDILTDCTIETLEGFNLTIDGIKVNEKYIDTEADTDSYSDNRVVYKIDKLIQGTHDVTLTSDYFEDLKGEVVVFDDYDEEYFSTDDDIVIKEDAKSKIIEKAEEQMKVITDGLSQNSDFSEISSKLSLDEDNTEDIEEEYESVLEYAEYSTDANTEGLIEAKYTSSDTTLDEEDTYSANISVSSKLNCAYSYRDKNYFTNTIETKNQTLDGDVSINFKVKDGELEIYSLYLPYFYYYY